MPRDAVISTLLAAEGQAAQRSTTVPMCGKQKSACLRRVVTSVECVDKQRRRYEPQQKAAERLRNIVREPFQSRADHADRNQKHHQYDLMQGQYCGLHQLAPRDIERCAASG